MGDTQCENNQFGVPYRIDGSIAADSDSPQVRISDELARTAWPGLDAQSVDGFPTLRAADLSSLASSLSALGSYQIAYDPGALIARVSEPPHPLELPPYAQSRGRPVAH